MLLGRFLFKFTLLLLLAFSLVGCPGDAPPPNRKVLINPLPGAWGSSCYPVTLNTVQFHKKDIIIFQDDGGDAGEVNVEKTTSFHAELDNACTGSPISQESSKGHYIIEDEISLADGKVVRSYDFTLLEFNGEILVDGAQETEYGMVFVEMVNGGDVLLLADTSADVMLDGTTPANRPVALDTTLVYSKFSLGDIGDGELADYGELQVVTSNVALGDAGTFNLNFATNIDNKEITWSVQPDDNLLIELVITSDTTDIAVTVTGESGIMYLSSAEPMIDLTAMTATFDKFIVIDINTFPYNTENTTKSLTIDGVITIPSSTTANSQ